MSLVPHCAGTLTMRSHAHACPYLVGEYVITAHKDGVVWGPPTVLRCVFPGTLVNAAPPWGPAAQN